LLNADKQLTIDYRPQFLLRTRASDKVLSVLIGNLIRNAFLYTDGGSIDISVKSDSIVISDSGKGIPPHQVDDMFKPYRRGENANVAGYGVGLTIVKRLSDRFNWPITIQSEPGIGTSIAVQFPECESHPL
jgi:signal transduction histidine kinase